MRGDSVSGCFETVSASGLHNVVFRLRLRSRPLGAPAGSRRSQRLLIGGHGEFGRAVDTSIEQRGFGMPTGEFEQEAEILQDGEQV